MRSTAHPCLIPAPATGFPAGYTALTRSSDLVFGSPLTLGIEFGVQRLKPGEIFADCSEEETVWVLLHGQAVVEVDGDQRQLNRASLFDTRPSAVNLAPETGSRWQAGPSGCELAVGRTANAARFAPRFYDPEQVVPEYRGAGLAQNACLRNVRLIFDRTTRPESNFVLGEVVNYPGRWSSYPPHHHDQPEIYHYRFTAESGYGHAELGEDVVKVRNGDTTVIPPDRDHAQVSAPGYGMYYLWLIRHLPGNPYTGFTFTEAHKWTLDATQQGWRPHDLPAGLV